MRFRGRALIGLILGLVSAGPAFAQSDSGQASEEEQTAQDAAAGAKAQQQQQEDAAAQASSGCGAGSIAVSTGGCGKRWRVIGYGEYRRLAVRDDDPKNDQQLGMWAQGSYRVVPKYNVQLWTRVGFSQRLVAEQGERAAQFNDLLVGADYLHSMPVPRWKGASLSFQHRFVASLPTSRGSQREDLRLGLTALERVRLSPAPYLYTGADLVGAYRIHEFAERAGPQGTPLPRANLTGRLVVEVYPFQGKVYGSLLVGADAGVSYTRTYEGRGTDNTVTGNPALWSQSFNWDVYAYYVPVSYLWLGLSLEHGSPVLRDGVVNPQFANRDETQLVFSAIGLY